MSPLLPTITRPCGSKNIQSAWQQYLTGLDAIESKSGRPVGIYENKLSKEVTAVMDHDADEHAKRLPRPVLLITKLHRRIADLEERKEEEKSGGLYALGDRIDFRKGGNADFFTHKGWEAAESWGSWTTGDFSVFIPAGKIKKDCEIVFEIHNSMSPRDLGLSEDVRPLGMGLVNLVFEWKSLWHRVIPLSGR